MARLKYVNPLRALRPLRHTKCSEEMMTLIISASVLLANNCPSDRSRNSFVMTHKVKCAVQGVALLSLALRHGCDCRWFDTSGAGLTVVLASSSEPRAKRLCTSVVLASSSEPTWAKRLALLTSSPRGGVEFSRCQSPWSNMDAGRTISGVLVNRNRFGRAILRWR